MSLERKSGGRGVPIRGAANTPTRDGRPQNRGRHVFGKSGGGTREKSLPLSGRSNQGVD